MKILLPVCLVLIASASQAGLKTPSGVELPDIPQTALELALEPGEGWWGGCNKFATKAPYALREKTFSFDNRRHCFANFAAPLMLSTHGRYVWCEQGFSCEIKDGKISFSANADAGPFKTGRDGKTLREAYLAAMRAHFPPTGKTPDLLFVSAPQWNTWIELGLSQSQEKILDYAHKVVDNGFPPGVIMLDDTWQLDYGTWEFDPRAFPDPKAMTDELHRLGFKVILWVCPFVSMDSREYRALDGKGGLLRDGRGMPAAIRWWDGVSAVLDFDKDVDKAWFKSVLDRLTKDYGVDGFKFDAGDTGYYDLPDQRQVPLAAGKEGDLNRHNENWSKFAADYPFNEMRASWKCGNLPLVQRLCDTGAGFPGIQPLIPNMIAAGLMGHGYVCPDMIGGGQLDSFWGGKVDEEAFVRSAQVHALCPMMQFSAAPWRVLSKENFKIVRDLVALRQKFAPRFVALAKECAVSGEPMLRSMDYQFPGCGYETVADQFVMGDFLIVAPQIEKGATSRKVLIPSGTWRGDDGKAVVGPAVLTVETPLARLPHFVKETRCEQTVTGCAVGDVSLTCEQADGWTFVCSRKAVAPGVDELEIRLSSPHEAKPPAFTVAWQLPQRDVQAFWTPQGDAPYAILPDWGGPVTSDFAHWAPIGALVSDRNRNRLVFATDEARRTVRLAAGLREETCALKCQLSFFTGTEAPIASYSVRMRFDVRDAFWSDAVAAAADWISAGPGNAPCAAPAAAFKPLYSTWYNFHQDVFAKDIEAECALAAKLGMKTLILDDGWQTDDTNRGYAFCGDWKVSPRRFPDMAAHVRRVQETGLKYMVWYSVPFVGKKSANYARFKGKYLYHRLGAGVLDPRFPEVRAFLVGVYEQALRDWNLDGFKLDFIDSFRIEGEDPAVKENYAGRDVKSVEEASDRLMGEIMARLKAIRPDLLVEFRQAYIGPSIRKYGNMFRVGDCPGDKNRNRRGIARLRLTSGKSAVHGDMLEWHPTESADVAARAVLDSIFGVVQYSMMLRNLPADHIAMIRHWADFSTRHEEALLHGAFRAYNPEHGYPLLEGESSSERIFGVYLAGFTVDCGALDRTTYVINGTGADRLSLRLRAAPKSVRVYDTFGKETAAPRLVAGLNEIPVPKSGYLVLTQDLP